MSLLPVYGRASNLTYRVDVADFFTGIPGVIAFWGVVSHFPVVRLYPGAFSPLHQDIPLPCPLWDAGLSTACAGVEGNGALGAG